MKKRIIFITKDFFPTSNGTILCIENVLPYLAPKYEIILYTKKTSADSLEVEVQDGVRIIRPKSLIDSVVLKKHSIVMQLKSRGRRIPSFTAQLIRVVLYPFTILSRIFGYLQDISWENNIARYIRKHEKHHETDAIIAVGAPFENFRAACLLKNKLKASRLILLQFDHYADNPELLLLDPADKKNYERRMAEEKDWYQTADRIIVTYEMINAVSSNHVTLKGKIEAAGMPSFYGMADLKPSSILKQSGDPFIDIVYTGLFYKDIRNPDYALETISRVITMNDHIRLHILGFGCEDIIAGYKNKLMDNLIIHGHQSKQVAINARYSANVLLNVSNSVGSQAPSKILEYIGSCKPIINFFAIDGDLCVEYLKDYPSSISIRADYDRIDENAKALYDFIMQAKDMTCDPDEIMRHYRKYHPSAYAEQIIAAIEAAKGDYERI